MRKKLMVAASLALIILVIAVPALADGGPHGGYTGLDDGCAGCHRGHTALGGNLLTYASTYDLCMSCHGSTATGAQTNVIDGVYEATAGSNVGDPLLGGLFDPAAVTSAHSVDGTVVDAWGGTIATGRGATVAALTTGLDCGSCHDPHGNDETTYRMLISTNPVTEFDPMGDKDYVTDAWTDTTLSDFCAECHVAYHETAANVGNDVAAQTAGGGYTHRVDMAWNLATSINVTAASFGPNNPETVGYDGMADSGDEIPLAGADAPCTTCHFPHGTAATMGTYSAAAGPAASSALLRLDNRGVCQACHQK